MTDFDAAVEVLQLGQVCPFKPPWLGPLRCGQQPQVCQLLTDLGCHFWVLGDLEDEPGACIACSSSRRERTKTGCGFRDQEPALAAAAGGDMGG